MAGLIYGGDETFDSLLKSQSRERQQIFSGSSSPLLTVENGCLAGKLVEYHQYDS